MTQPWDPYARDCPSRVVLDRIGDRLFAFQRVFGGFHGKHFHLRRIVGILADIDRHFFH